jgi:AmiR/NasT family two-component response regulator
VAPVAEEHNLIDQAQGILMERFKVTAEQAFTVLARASQDTNNQLRDVAQRLIDTGKSPGR